MSQSYSLARPVEHEIVIKKSRFICYLEPCQSKAQAQQRIQEIRQQYPDARHVCSAFYCGTHTGLDDDGEPSGTAAKPMFQVIQMQHLRNTLAIVVRYFGGIKLGAGGLVRAYGGAVSEALKLTGKVPVIQLEQWRLRVPTALEHKVRHWLTQQQLTVQSIDYVFEAGINGQPENLVTLDFASESDPSEALVELSQGQAQLERLDP